MEESKMMNLSDVLKAATTQESQMDINVSLSKKEKTHCIYKETANLSQSLKDVMRSGRNWQNLNDQQKESLECIAMKLARLLNGNQNHRDHWDDVAGYATLGGDGGALNLPTVRNDLEEALGQ